MLHVQNTGEVWNGARPVSVGSAPDTRQRVRIPKVIVPCRWQPLSMLGLKTGASYQNSKRAGPNFMALLTAEFCAYDHDSPLTCKRRISALAL